MPRQSSLFIVSNRLPVTATRKSKDAEFDITTSSGGLVSGLMEIHDTSKDLWIGHCGLFSKDKGFPVLQNQLQKHRFHAVELSKDQYKSYYNGMCNGGIWPLSHYFTTNMKISRGNWDAYQQVNKIFAKTVLSLAQPDDMVWVHDYQLMLVPEMLRQANKNLKISYFHHIPFPSSEIFRVLPYREKLLQGLLGSDYIGFHTYDYVRHFLTSTMRLLGCEVHMDEIHYDNRIIKIGAHPLGVDFKSINKISMEIDSEKDSPKIVERLEDKIVLLGVDRLDYTKGIPERLEAFKEFLTENPEYVGKASLIQLCVPSREEVEGYGNLKAKIERLVGQINGEFAKPGYSPIQYLYKSVTKDELIALYKAAHIALVTPMRDGLNLVCKEYISARFDDDGVLILSEFAGAAAEMGEAVLVNPFDQRSVARAILKSVTMNPSERKRRMRILRDKIKEFDNIYWARSFFDAWRNNMSGAGLTSLRLKGNPREGLIKSLANSNRIFLFLDNDGTLTQIASRPELAVPSKKIQTLLSKLGERPKLTITIITGRPRDFCEKYFTHLPINIVAEHGAFIWERGENKWHSQLGVEEFEDIKQDILKLLDMYTRNIPGTHIEEKETCIVWHYREADEDFAATQAKNLIDSLQQQLRNTSLTVYPGKKSVEIRQIIANKGYAVEHFLEEERFTAADAMVTVGDDKTDEDMYKVHGPLNLSIHIGQSNMFADYFLESPDDLADFLCELGGYLESEEISGQIQIDDNYCYSGIEE